ncbi:ATP synthase subunit I [Vibrio cincinnatiensis]|jgi:F0F1-type ATP synthase assembly protein I|uniref:ATP synthase I chain n=1 Tax=Vibrio cincinnatiensis DSM 19608 TaxID=1123491 RepID=A0A1T4R7X4_VIBCI|nr:ATP synthase subunit I [Vibrio cincinnatiensis]MCG3722387.1 hypothetical protein [Vibrio cincinnatiensis]MCG3735974.1 hypothetical protein [Vibrio cincinnatiensis]MCG3746404.1 hypothetical protein [Vibrio cincinnatiensis]MCG3758247.1 hypothetical protein [Vibrio cincinnatiensis]MCG3761544.1 hypothetical protein [Vibrio cincinnatiensis]
MFIAAQSRQAKAAFRIVHLQLAFLLLIGGVTYMYWGPNPARFILKGGAIAVIGNYVYTLFAFLPKPNADGTVLLGFIMMGWALKLVLTITMFVLIFNLADVQHPGAMMSGYKLTLLVFWVAPILLTAKNGNHHG